LEYAVIKTFLSAAFAVAIAATLATPADAADTMARLSSAKLAAMLTGAGATDVKVHPPSNGLEFVTFNDGNGPASFVLGECAADGCEVLQMMIFYTKEDVKDFSLATINSYNAGNLNAQAAFMPSGELALMRLFVTTGGVTEANIMANVVIFLQSPDALATHIKDQKVASTATPATAAPVSASPASGVQAGIAVQGPRLKKLNVFDILSKQPAFPTRRLP
jgi:hypothetical protein